MRRLLCILIVLILVLSLIGCDSLKENATKEIIGSEIDDKLTPEEKKSPSGNDNIAANEEVKVVLSNIVFDPATGNATTSEGYLIEAAYISDIETI